MRCEQFAQMDGISTRPAMFTDLNVALNVPSYTTGWEAKAYTKVTFYVPDNWKSGRIWGRRNCDFSKNPGPNSCLTGGCNGGLGVPPATVAEWTLGGDSSTGVDWYDVSLVDGYNLPMRISNNKGCPVVDCPVDLGPNCPSPLKGPFDSTGFPVGCKSACFANLDGNQESNCPNSYAYAYDEASGTALRTCASSLKADYTLTFCP
ncbi:hypothetical protein D9619_009727 [Psilocybe cf. subviscida]|uniref:Thaumatin-like protein n=1 Tax=Psilocybe cf. subviscida TaxID=2480587 RepID=A0A8H5F6Y6_9AGAR|nr:hypothetical protein D9619_009727 [Psilocybe cf. subviscida]